MASYRHIKNTSLLSQVVSGSVTSDALDVSSMTMAAFYITYAAGLTCAFAIQGSLNGTDFADLGVSIPSAAGSAGSALVNLDGLAVSYVRVSISGVSGSALTNVKGSAKGVG